MEKDIFTPFANAASQTFKLLLDVEAYTEADGSNEISKNADEIGVSIGITGDLSGEIFYRFPKETTLEIVKLMSGIEFTEIDEFVISATGEIANIISGNAVTDLSDRNIICDILPPEITGSDKSSPADKTTYLFSAIVKTTIGNVEVLLRLEM